MKRALKASLQNHVDSLRNSVDFQRTGAVQPQTKLLANQLLDHITNKYGNQWFLYFTDALSLNDIAKINNTSIIKTRQKAAIIREEIRAWSSAGK